MRRKFHRESVCFARRCHRSGPISVPQQPGPCYAAFAYRFNSARAKEPADVHSVHAPKIVPSDSRRLRRFRNNSLRRQGGFPNHSRRHDAIQGVVAIYQKVTRIFCYNFVKLTLVLIFRSKSCKKDLWAQINSALQANSK